MRGLYEAQVYCRNFSHIIPVVVVSDSQYVIKGITQWIHNWQKNGWRTSQKKSVENQDLWKELWTLSQSFSQISWQWVAGHAGHPENEQANLLAQNAVKNI